MALGGGTFISQNKKLPGTYINFASVRSASATIGERGVAAMALEMDWGKDGEIFEVTSEDFTKNSFKMFGYDYSNEKMKGLRDLFKNITKAYFYRLNSGVKARNDFATAKYSGTRGNDIKIVIAKNVDDENKYDVSTYLGTKLVDEQTVANASELVDNDYIVFNKSAVVYAQTTDTKYQENVNYYSKNDNNYVLLVAGTDYTVGDDITGTIYVVSATGLTITAGTPLTGGENGTNIGATHQEFLDKLESYSVNAIGCTSSEQAITNLYVEYAKRLRDEQGIKFQVVLFNKAANYEGVVNVKNTALEGDTVLIYWVTGIIAGCEINRSNTNKTYDGEYTVNADYTQAQLETSIDNGEFVFHKVGSDIKVLVDINSLVSTTDDKDDNFKSNQTIRVIDQIASDVASIFNSKYIGKIPNNEAGRTSLWGDIVALFKEYQTLQAIENFEDGDISVDIGNDKKSVTINTNVQIINAMEKLYMTVIVE